jgi:hypothetical protein
METVIVGAWSIWKERNNMLFNGIDPCTEQRRICILTSTTL